jgi:hypothetical protein
VIPSLLRNASVLGLAAFLLAPAPTAEAQQPAPPAKAAAGAAFNPLGDPSKFTRMGGWGGFGGAMGQFGLGKAMLVMTPAVQKELKLGDGQKKDLQEWSDGLRKRGETMFRGQTPNAGQPADAPPADGPPPGFNPLGMIETMTTLVREGESGLAKILDKKQSARLSQIALQMEGISALGRQEVADAVYLSDDQVEAIREILQETKNNQMGLMMRQALTMRRPRSGPAAPQPADQNPRAAKAGDPQAAEAKGQPAARDDEDPEAAAKRRAADREKRMGELSKFREGFDRIQDENNAKILRLLTRKQRDRFNKLLGEPFDASKLGGPGGFGGPGGPPRAAAEAEGEVKPTTPTATGEPSPASTRGSRLRDRRGGSPKGTTEP